MNGCPSCTAGADGPPCDEHGDEFAFSMGRAFQKAHGDAPITFRELLTSVCEVIGMPRDGDDS